MLKDSDKRVILCVDDEKIILDSLESELSQKLPSNYIIELAESGEEAFEIIEELIEDGLDIALVVSDYIMPGMKGDEVLIKAHEIVPDALKIMLTGQADANAVGNVINKAKLYQYVSKPWEKDELWLTINSALENYEQHKSILAILDEKKDAQKKIIATRKQMFEVHNSKLKEQQNSVDSLKKELDILKVENETLLDRYSKLDESYKKVKLQNSAYQTKIKQLSEDTSFDKQLAKEIERTLEFNKVFVAMCCGIDSFDMLINKWQDKATETRLLSLLEQYLKELLPSYNKIERISGGRYKVILAEIKQSEVQEYISNLSKSLSSKIGRFGDDLITISFFAKHFDSRKYDDRTLTVEEIVMEIDKDIENGLGELRTSQTRNSIVVK
jgi:CheY-like chemotaxis protein